MDSPRMTRRSILQKCLAFGSLTIVPSISATELIAAWNDREKLVRKATPLERTRSLLQKKRTTDGVVAKTWRSRDAAFG